MDLDHLKKLLDAALLESEETNADGPAYQDLLGYLDSTTPVDDDTGAATVATLRTDRDRLAAECERLRALVGEACDGWDSVDRNDEDIEARTAIRAEAKGEV